MPTVSICHIDCYGHGFNPEKVRFRDESHQFGVELRPQVQPRKVVLRDERYQCGVELGCGFQFNPEKLCSEMKGTSGGLQRWKPSMAG